MYVKLSQSNEAEERFYFKDDEDSKLKTPPQPSLDWKILSAMLAEECSRVLKMCSNWHMKQKEKLIDLFAENL